MRGSKGSQPWQGYWLLLHSTSWPTSCIPGRQPQGDLVTLTHAVLSWMTTVAPMERQSWKGGKPDREG